MDSELSRSLFLKAREQYDSAVRMALLAIGVLFLFHLLTLSPYLQWSRQLVTAKAELDRLTKSRDTLEGVTADLKLLTESSRQRLKTLGDELYNNLRSDFERLDTAVDEALHGISPSSRANMAVQAQLVTPKPFVLDEVTVARLKDANNNMDQVRKILRSTVNGQIVAPRFAEVNQAWQETSGKMISEKTKQLLISA